ncbi:uncharacterized protein LOC108680224 isoform X2 [Hyalella azteca]|uniref:Uncharacterized protein LOC108680224 isoform X2 n=1 Tax=Hyalella azteca TaxID=294128 RepID=A0A8B7PEF7_HYAAZ|nr:uncharacterized protein LOC108680224 isoform X2 [Hyalella azteca]
MSSHCDPWCVWKGNLVVGVCCIGEASITCHGLQYVPPIGSQLAFDSTGRAEKVLHVMLGLDKPVQLSLIHPTAVNNNTVTVATISSENSAFKKLSKELSSTLFPRAICGFVRSPGNVCTEVVILPSCATSLAFGLVPPNSSGTQDSLAPAVKSIDHPASVGVNAATQGCGEDLFIIFVSRIKPLLMMSNLVSLAEIIKKKAEENRIQDKLLLESGASEEPLGARKLSTNCKNELLSCTPANKVKVQDAKMSRQTVDSSKCGASIRPCSSNSPATKRITTTNCDIPNVMRAKISSAVSRLTEETDKTPIMSAVQPVADPSVDEHSTETSKIGQEVEKVPRKRSLVNMVTNKNFSLGLSSGKKSVTSTNEMIIEDESQPEPIDADHAVSKGIHNEIPDPDRREISHSCRREKHYKKRQKTDKERQAMDMLKRTSRTKKHRHKESCPRYQKTVMDAEFVIPFEALRNCSNMPDIAQHKLENNSSVVQRAPVCSMTSEKETSSCMKNTQVCPKKRDSKQYSNFEKEKSRCTRTTTEKPFKNYSHRDAVISKGSEPTRDARKIAEVIKDCHGVKQKSVNSPRTGSKTVNINVPRVNLFEKGSKSECRNLPVDPAPESGPLEDNRADEMQVNTSPIDSKIYPSNKFHPESDDSFKVDHSIGPRESSKSKLPKSHHADVLPSNIDKVHVPNLQESSSKLLKRNAQQNSVLEKNIRCRFSGPDSNKVTSEDLTTDLQKHDSECLKSASPDSSWSEHEIQCSEERNTVQGLRKPKNFEHETSKLKKRGQSDSKEISVDSGVLSISDLDSDTKELLSDLESNEEIRMLLTTLALQEALETEESLTRALKDMNIPDTDKDILTSKIKRLLSLLSSSPKACNLTQLKTSSFVTNKDFTKSETSISEDCAAVIELEVDETGSESYSVKMPKYSSEKIKYASEQTLKDGLSKVRTLVDKFCGKRKEATPSLVSSPFKKLKSELKSDLKVPYVLVEDLNANVSTYEALDITAGAANLSHAEPCSFSSVSDTVSRSEPASAIINRRSFSIELPLEENRNNSPDFENQNEPLDLSVRNEDVSVNHVGNSYSEFDLEYPSGGHHLEFPHDGFVSSVTVGMTKEPNSFADTFFECSNPPSILRDSSLSASLLPDISAAKKLEQSSTSIGNITSSALGRSVLDTSNACMALQSPESETHPSISQTHTSCINADSMASASVNLRKEVPASAAQGEQCSTNNSFHGAQYNALPSSSMSTATSGGIQQNGEGFSVSSLISCMRSLDRKILDEHAALLRNDASVRDGLNYLTSLLRAQDLKASGNSCPNTTKVNSYIEDQLLKLHDVRDSYHSSLDLGTVEVARSQAKPSSMKTSFDVGICEKSKPETEMSETNRPNVYHSNNSLSTFSHPSSFSEKAVKSSPGNENIHMKDVAHFSSSSTVVGKPPLPPCGTERVVLLQRIAAELCQWPCCSLRDVAESTPVAAQPHAENLTNCKYASIFMPSEDERQQFQKLLVKLRLLYRPVSSLIEDGGGLLLMRSSALAAMLLDEAWNAVLCHPAIRVYTYEMGARLIMSNLTPRLCSGQLLLLHHTALLDSRFGWMVSDMSRDVLGRQPAYHLILISKASLRRCIALALKSRPSSALERSLFSALHHNLRMLRRGVAGGLVRVVSELSDDAASLPQLHRTLHCVHKKALLLTGARYANEAAMQKQFYRTVTLSTLCPPLDSRVTPPSVTLDPILSSSWPLLSEIPAMSASSANALASTSLHQGYFSCSNIKEAPRLQKYMASSMEPTTSTVGDARTAIDCHDTGIPSGFDCLAPHLQFSSHLHKTLESCASDPSLVTKLQYSDNSHLPAPDQTFYRSPQCLPYPILDDAASGFPDFQLPTSCYGSSALPATRCTETKKVSIPASLENSDRPISTSLFADANENIICNENLHSMPYSSATTSAAIRSFQPSIVLPKETLAGCPSVQSPSITSCKVSSPGPQSCSSSTELANRIPAACHPASIEKSVPVVDLVSVQSKEEPTETPLFKTEYFIDPQKNEFCRDSSQYAMKEEKKVDAETNDDDINLR